MMKSNILVCPGCHSYSLAGRCEACGLDAITPHPPKFSPEDRYGKYRRQLKAMSAASNDSDGWENDIPANIETDGKSGASDGN